MKGFSVFLLTFALCLLTLTSAFSDGNDPPVGESLTGGILAWGSDSEGQATPPAGWDYTAIASGSLHSLALRSDGSIVGWGDNWYGQASPPEGNDFVAIAAGSNHSLALRQDGSLTGWGDNRYGQASPPEGDDFVAIAAGIDHSLALREDGSLVDWGMNLYSDDSPPEGNNFVAIAAGAYHLVALRQDGSLAAWGSNWSAQASPPEGNDFVAIAAGGEHSLALRQDGSLTGWGGNWYGQASPPEGNDFVAIAAGDEHSLALRENGTVVSWGSQFAPLSDLPKLLAIAAGGATSLALRQLPPGPVELLSPAGGESLSTRRPVFSWSSDIGTTLYSIQINHDGGTHYSEWISGLKGNTWTPPSDLLPGRYTWWVYTATPFEGGAWSNPANFFIDVSGDYLATIQGVDESSYSFEDWRAAVGLPPGTTPLMQAPSGIGVSNLIKFALAIPSLGGGAKDLPSQVILSRDGQLYQGLVFPRARRAAGVRFQLETSENLVDWERVETPLEVLQTLREGVEQVRMVDAIPLTQSATRFLRVRVSADAHVGHTPVSGGEMEIIGPDGESLATGIVGDSGRYQIFFGDDFGAPYTYQVVLRDGIVGGTPFSGELTATYLEGDPSEQLNLTLLTTLVDAIAETDLVGGLSPSDRRQAAIALLIDLGMIEDGEWNTATPRSVNVSTLWEQVNRAGGVGQWTAALIAELGDGELSPQWMDGFPWAHGGILDASALGQAFQNRTYRGFIEVDSALEDVQQYDYQLIAGPNGMTLNEEGVVERFVAADAPPGNVGFSYRVINTATGKGRDIEDTFYVMETEIVAEGMVGPEGGTVSDDWDEHVLRVPGPGGVSSMAHAPEGVNFLSFALDTQGSFYGLASGGEDESNVLRLYSFDGLDWEMTITLGEWAGFLPGNSTSPEENTLQLLAGDDQRLYLWLSDPQGIETMLVEIDAVTGVRSILLTADNLVPGSAVIAADQTIYVAGYAAETFPLSLVFRFDRASGQLVEVASLEFEETQPPSAFGEALGQPNWAFTTGGDSAWFVQTEESWYGGSTARSGSITHNEHSWIETAVTGPGELSFWWQVSSESNYDFLEFYRDGVRQDRISGESVWHQKTYELGAGENVLRWRYMKDGSVTVGADAGWLAGVMYEAHGSVLPASGQQVRLRTGPEGVLYAYNDPRGADAFTVFRIDPASGNFESVYSLNEDIDFDDFAIGEDGAFHLTGVTMLGDQGFGFIDRVDADTLERMLVAKTPPLTDTTGDGGLRLHIISAADAFVVEAYASAAGERQLFLIQPYGAVDEDTIFRILRGVAADGHYAYTVQTEPEERVTRQMLSLSTPPPVHRTLELDAGEIESEPFAAMPMSASAQSSPTWRPWRAGRAVFLSIRNSAGTVLAGGADLTFGVGKQSTNRFPHGSPSPTFFEDQSAFNVFSQTSFELLGYTREWRQSEPIYENAVPVLFIHGFTKMGQLGGGSDTWGDFPEILSQETDSNGNKRFILFEFRYRSNARFQDIAMDLNEAIQQIQMTYPKPVHIIAHSFGGLVARTYLQGLATESDYNDNVASLVTLSTPHSGIFPSAGTRGSQWFPSGTHGVSGNILIHFHRQFSAYQAGNASNLAYSYNSSLDLRPSLGLTRSPGWIVGQLASNPFPDIPVTVGIGLAWELTNVLAPSHFKRYKVSNGDALISFEGQRFHPDLVGKPLSGMNWQNIALSEYTLAYAEGYNYWPNFLPGKQIPLTSYRLGYRHSVEFGMRQGWAVAKVTRDRQRQHHAYYLVMRHLDEHAAPTAEVALPAVDITVRIVDADTSAPMAAAELLLSSGGLERNPTEVDQAEGVFTFSGVPFQPGTEVYIRVNYDGYRTGWSRSVFAGFNEVRDFLRPSRLFYPHADPTEPIDVGTIHLQPDEAGRGDFIATLTTAAGPLSGAFWELLRNDGGRLDSGYTGANGQVSSSNLARGTYRLRISKTGLQTNTVDILIRSDETTEVLVSLAPIDPVPAGFARIPAGWFTMGDSLDGNSIAPPVSVYVSEFHMARHHVTWELWNEVRNWAVNNDYTDIAAGGGKGANHPVHTVSWWDVVKWCNARSQREGLTPVYRNADGTVFKTGTDEPTANWSANGYRLPTEAEWEKAARGGLSGQRFPWGNEINHSHANYLANGDAYAYDTSPYTTFTYHPSYNDGSGPYTSPVGSFAPNGYGLYDMAGNVWEWCWDWYSASTYTEGAYDPKGPSSGTNRVYRGGSWGGGWFGIAFDSRTAFRNGDLPGNPGGRSGYGGFRLARSQ